MSVRFFSTYTYPGLLLPLGGMALGRQDGTEHFKSVLILHQIQIFHTKVDKETVIYRNKSI